MFENLKNKVLDILLGAFELLLVPEIHEPQVEESEFVEEKPGVIDDVCYMSLEESRDLKRKMENDVKIAKEVVEKAERLIKGEINLYSQKEIPYEYPNPKLKNESIEHWNRRKAEDEFDEAISNMEKSGNFINWLEKEDE